jgi:predicted AAA+ superfamily ATPase
MPLKSYEDFSAFKLYAHDVGLLAAMSDIPHRMLIEGNRIFTHFKGTLTEQFVLGELVASGVTPYYWATDEGMAEVEFVVQGADDIYPLEVKAERNLQSKSLKSYRDRFAPSKCLRSSLAERAVGKFTDDIPLYAIGSVIRDYL